MVKDFNIKLVIKTLSIFLLVESMLMLSAFIVSFCYGEKDAFYILLSTVFIFFVGILAFYYTQKERGRLAARESYVCFTFLWIILSLGGLFPFLLSGAIPSFTDAFFESLSGFTTTGSSILITTENLSHGLLYWRSCMQWFGGVCFIVLSLFILPVLGIGGVKRSANEPISFHSDKLHPRIGNSIKWLAIIYFSFTVIETIFLVVAGMNVFDAVCHSFSTVSTGGFSTKTTNIAYWNSSSINIVLTIFMFLAGVNFALYYYVVVGKFKKLIANEESYYYFLFTLLFSVIVALGLYFTMNEAVGDALEMAFFHVASTISTTGFYTVDMMMWTPVLLIFTLMLMFWGASYGSAGGSIKTVRIVLILKNSFHELRRFIHPNAISIVRLDNKLVPLPIINNAFMFLLLYIFVCIVGILFMIMLGIHYGDAVKMVLTSIGNIGCGTGVCASSEGFAYLPALGKYCLMFLMLVGRLELYAFFILFTRSFWKK
jgi:trk system potassium uptake protein TrkH